MDHSTAKKKACSNVTPSHLSPLLDVLWLLPSSPATASQVGRGARWSADRAQAWELQDGELTRSISLQEAAQIAGSVGLPGAAARCERLAEEVDAGIVAHGTVERPELGGKVYAYEVDGFGNAHLMDDANVPSLLSLPWLGYLAATDPTYERTRAYGLSPKTNVRAAPSPHTIPGRVPCLTCACGERQPRFYSLGSEGRRRAFATRLSEKDELLYLVRRGFGQ